MDLQKCRNEYNGPYPSMKCGTMMNRLEGENPQNYIQCVQFISNKI